MALSEFVLDAMDQVGATRKNTSVSPPSPRPSPKGEGADLWCFQNLFSTQWIKSVYSERQLGQSPLPLGEG